VLATAPVKLRNLLGTIVVAFIVGFAMSPITYLPAFFQVVRGIVADTLRGVPAA